MRYLLTVVLILIIGTSACNDIRKNREDKLPPEVMKKILTDIHIAESYSTMRADSTYKNGTKNVDSLAVYYRDILAHYNLTPEQFQENLEWYKEQATDLDSVYDKMIPVISAMQAKAGPIPPQPQPIVPLR